jgi:hypothetical protein
MQGPAWTMISYLASHMAEMTGVCHHAQLLLIEIGSYNLFAWAGLEPQSS